jgi:hypothetical protein
MKTHLMKLLSQGFSSAQIMAHHKEYVKKKVLKNEPITRDTFILPFDVRNLSRKRIDEIMAETPQGSNECVNVGYGKPKFNFLLC